MCCLAASGLFKPAQGLCYPFETRHGCGAVSLVQLLAGELLKLYKMTQNALELDMNLSTTVTAFLLPGPAHHGGALGMQCERQTQSVH